MLEAIRWYFLLLFVCRGPGTPAKFFYHPDADPAGFCYLSNECKGSLAFTAGREPVVIYELDERSINDLWLFYGRLFI
jgi:hypothetical protein